MPCAGIKANGDFVAGLGIIANKVGSVDYFSN